jgi:hypothetical protein
MLGGRAEHLPKALLPPAGVVAGLPSAAPEQMLPHLPPGP